MSIFSGFHPVDPSHAAPLEVSYDDNKNINCPAWVDKEKFNTIFNNLVNPEINSNAGRRAKTLKILNQNQNNLENKSLLYLGGGSDIEHPLIATGANKITFVDLQGSFNETEAKLTNLINSDSFHLKVDKNESNNKAHFSVVDKKTEEEIFSLDFYKMDYDNFIQKVVRENTNLFDIVMDKDSWLVDWNREQKEEKFLKIGSIVKSNGVWIGGYDSKGEEEGFPRVKMTMSSLFDRATDVFAKAVAQNTLEWSGYENLEVRIRTSKGIPEIRNELEGPLNDPISGKLQNQLQDIEVNEIRTHLQVIQDKFNQYNGNVRQSLLDSLKTDWQGSLPYLLVFDRLTAEGIDLAQLEDDEELSEKNELVNDIILCLADSVEEKWNAAPHKDSDFDKQQFKNDLKIILMENFKQ